MRVRVKTKPPRPETIRTPASVKPTIAQRGKLFAVATAAARRCWRRFRCLVRGVVPVVAEPEPEFVVVPAVVVRVAVGGGGGGGAGGGVGGGAVVGRVVGTVTVVRAAVMVVPVSLGAADTPPASAKPASASPAAQAATKIGRSNRLVRMSQVFPAEPRPNEPTGTVTGTVAGTVAGTVTGLSGLSPAVGSRRWR